VAVDEGKLKDVQATTNNVDCSLLTIVYMINVIIYLNEVNEAKELVDHLLETRLIANASIDANNISYRMENDEIITSVNSVITAQTKALLFSEIERFILTKYGTTVQLFSTPITQASTSFDSFIRNSTSKI
jgi:uncharacterized protein involved in tolerance to divalent cations